MLAERSLLALQGEALGGFGGMEIVCVFHPEYNERLLLVVGVPPPEKVVAQF